MVAVPPEIPLTTPVEEPTIATGVLPLLHTPPIVALVRMVLSEGHTSKVPVMGKGSGPTVTWVVAAQPVPKE